MTNAITSFNAAMDAADKRLRAAQAAYDAARKAAYLAYDRDYQIEIAAKEQA